MRSCFEQARPPACPIKRHRHQHSSLLVRTWSWWSSTWLWLTPFESPLLHQVTHAGMDPGKASLPPKGPPKGGGSGRQHPPQLHMPLHLAHGFGMESPYLIPFMTVSAGRSGWSSGEQRKWLTA